MINHYKVLNKLSVGGLGACEFTMRILDAS